MKLNAVNVVETVDDNLLSVRSFTDDEDGNKEAESLFCKCINENADPPLERGELECFMEDGAFRSFNYSVYLCHSTE